VIKHYSQLARRMTLVGLVVALLPLNLLGVGIYYYFVSANQEKLKEEMLVRAVNRAEAIELFLAERTAVLEVLAHSGQLARLSDQRELTKALQVLNRRTSTFLDLGVIDASGNHRSYVGPYPLQNQNYRDAEWFQQVMLRGVHVSDVFLGVRKVPHFVIAVKQEDEGETWILRATIDSEVFNRLVRSAQVGLSGDAYIVNSRGQLQTPSRFAGGILTPTDFNIEAVPPGNTVVERQVPGGRTLFTAFTWLSSMPWLLVVDQDPREMPGPLSQARRVDMAIVWAANLLILALVLLLVRLFIKQLQANDRERAALDAQVAHSARLVSLGRMAAGVAHEINNPLAAIGELAGELGDILQPEVLAQLPEGNICRDNLTKILGQVERARGVTHRMLKFARSTEPTLEKLDVNQVVKESFSFVEKEARFHNLAVELKLDSGLPLIPADRAQLQQVLLNLLNNAIDAAGQNGRLVIATTRDGTFVQVRVTDSGPGVPPEVGERVFDPFFTTKAPGQGTGLGLSISHSIMEKMGGSLAFESPPRQGATFIASLPIAGSGTG
jgi:two-component system, NtrC family, sensor kinase